MNEGQKEGQKARVVNCDFSQRFLVRQDEENPLTPDTVFVGKHGEIISCLTSKDCGKYQPTKDNRQDSLINAITKKKPVLGGLWTSQTPVVICNIHSCRAHKNHVIKNSRRGD